MGKGKGIATGVVVPGFGTQGWARADTGVGMGVEGCGKFSVTLKTGIEEDCLDWLDWTSIGMPMSSVEYLRGCDIMRVVAEVRDALAEH